MSGSFEFARKSFQAQAATPDDVVCAWEAARGVLLPADYRRFMTRFGGGALRPNSFVCPVTDPRVFDQDKHAIETLFDWPQVLKASQFRIDPPLRNVPPNRLAIGSTDTELTLMLSLEPARFGAIDAWVRDIFNVWGEGMNLTVVPVAPSFSAFIDMLHDDPQAHHSFWADHDQQQLSALRITLP